MADARLTPTVAKVQNGAWYTLRSLAVWFGATTLVFGGPILLSNLGACASGHILILKCQIDWNTLSYAIASGTVAAAIRFVQGYLAKPPPQSG
jgi:hypothetical protein